jgi:hypothetical protein
MPARSSASAPPSPNPPPQTLLSETLVPSDKKPRVLRRFRSYVHPVTKTELQVGDCIALKGDKKQKPFVGMIVGFISKWAVDVEFDLNLVEPAKISVDVLWMYRYEDVVPDQRALMAPSSGQWLAEDAVALSPCSDVNSLDAFIGAVTVVFNPKEDLRYSSQAAQRPLRCAHCYDPNTQQLCPIQDVRTLKLDGAYRDLVVDRVTLGLNVVLARKSRKAPSSFMQEYDKPQWASKKLRPAEVPGEFGRRHVLTAPLPLVPAQAQFDILSPATWTPRSADFNLLVQQARKQG